MEVGAAQQVVANRVSEVQIAKPWKFCALFLWAGPELAQTNFLKHHHRFAILEVAQQAANERLLPPSPTPLEQFFSSSPHSLSQTDFPLYSSPHSISFAPSLALARYQVEGAREIR